MTFRVSVSPSLEPCYFGSNESHATSENLTRNGRVCHATAFVLRMVFRHWDSRVHPTVVDSV